MSLMDRQKFVRYLCYALLFWCALGGYATLLTWLLENGREWIFIAGMLVPFTVAVAAVEAGWEPGLED